MELPGRQTGKPRRGRVHRLNGIGRPGGVLRPAHGTARFGGLGSSDSLERKRRLVRFVALELLAPASHKELLIILLTINGCMVEF